MHKVSHGDVRSSSLEWWQKRMAELALGVLTCAAAVATFVPAGSPARSAAGSPAGSPSTSSTAADRTVQAVATDAVRVVTAAAPATGTRAAVRPTTERVAEKDPARKYPARKRAAKKYPARARPVGRRTVGVGPEVRAVPARSVEGSAKDATVRNVLTLSFKARKGDRRMVAGQVKAYQPEDTPDPLLLASTSLSCTPSAGRVQSSSATENVLRGRSTWLSTAFVYVAPSSGTVRCVVRAYGSRPRPTAATGSTTYNRWYAWHGSRLYLGSPQPHWAASASTSARSRLIGRGQTTSTLSRYAPGSSGKNQILLVTDHKLTTCSSARGSRDATTRGRELCRGHVQKTGSRVRLVMRILQGDGRSCTPRPVVDRVYRISAKAHHRTIRGLKVIDPASSRCRGRLTVSTTLKNVGGAPVMVQTKFGRTSIAQG